MNLKLAIVVTSMCFGGRPLWVQIPALPLPRCVLNTWDKSLSLSGWLSEPHETRCIECLWVYSVATFSRTMPSVSFLRFFPLVIVMCVLPIWYWSHLLPSLGLTPVSVTGCSVIRASKWLLQSPAIRLMVGHVGGCRGCKFWKLHREFY